MQGLALVVVIVIVVFISILALFSRYKRCPSDKILVIYGKTGKTKSGTHRSAKTIHGGAAFIWPVIQNYAFLDLTPISLEVNLTNALSRQNIRIDVPSRFTVGISTEPGVMTNAAERLLGIPMAQIQELAKDIIFGQLRLVVATMDIEEINTDRDKFLANVSQNVEAELQKIGLKLINVNVTDIRDESEYIEALGKEAAAKAINDAKKTVAEKNRDGAIGEAKAVQDQRVQVADANARAVEGENTAKIAIAKSDATRREREAEAERQAVAAEKVQAAKALEESYKSEKIAEDERSNKARSTQIADVIVPAQIDKEKIEIDAEARAEQIRRIAKGDADAILMKKQAEAQGIYEVLTKQASGFEKLVMAANQNAREAALMMIADKLPELVKTQVEAIKNLKIDKITVWDTGSGDGKKPSTANFLSGMLQSIPPFDELFKMAGLELPDYLKGKKINEDGQFVEIDEDDDFEEDIETNEESMS
jgi:flotillin